MVLNWNILNVLIQVTRLFALFAPLIQTDLEFCGCATLVGHISVLSKKSNFG